MIWFIAGAAAGLLAAAIVYGWVDRLIEWLKGKKKNR